jgi:DNA-binding LacI/PurR family transcriptional regulator
MLTISDITIAATGASTKVDQIVSAIKKEILTGKLESNTRLPSINDLSRQYKVSRETIEKAYRELQRQGLIFPVTGKGNFVSQASLVSKRVLMVLDNLDSHNRDLYSAFSSTLGLEVKIDLQIYHGDTDLLNEIIESSKGIYDHYVVLPQYTGRPEQADSNLLLRDIPEGKLIVLEQMLPPTDSQGTNIYQDFRSDMFEALSHQSRFFDKYRGITLVISNSTNHCDDIYEGVKRFCSECSKSFRATASFLDVSLQQGEAYIVAEESDLADVIKKLRNTDLVIGEDVGILSLHESLLNQLLDISVVTRDYQAMGEMAARLILDKRASVVRNSYKVIQRMSL